MFCNKCGTSVPDGMKFCHKCGAMLPTLAYWREEDAQQPLRSTEISMPHVFQKVRNERRKRKNRPSVVVYGAVIVLVLVAAFFATYYGTGAVVKNKAGSVYYLEAYDAHNNYLGSGSGFLISSTDIATNYHVIEGAATIIAVSADNAEKVSISSVTAYDKTTDLTVLRSPSPLKANPLKLANSDTVRQGDKIYAIGYPLGLSNTLSDGIVSARYTDSGVDYLQITAAVSPGSSGGVLLNSKGQVVGVVCAYYIDGQNMNVAIASNEVRNLIDRQEGIKPLSSVSR